MDDDLDDVLRHLDCHPDVWHRLANSQLTRNFLEGGIKLFEEEFFDDPADGERPEPRSFLWLSRNQVVEAARELQDPSCVGGDGALRHRWSAISAYRGDLILYALRTHRWRERIGLTKQAVDAISDKRRGGDKLSDLVHDITNSDLKFMTDDTAMRFHFFVTAFAGRDPVVADALGAVYVKITEVWHDVYAEFFRTRKLKLRPGASLDDFTVLLSAVAEGLALRMIGSRVTPVLDDRRRCLLGTAVLALMIAFVDPGDGETIEQAADRIADPGSADPPSHQRSVEITQALDRLTARGVIARPVREHRPTASGRPRPRPRSRGPDAGLVREQGG